MQLITLVPMFLCAWYVYRKNTQTAFLYVLLPVLLLMPTYYSMVIHPLPGVDFLECTLVPLMIGMVLFDGLRWRPAMMDIWVLVFIFSTGYADHELGKTTQASFTWFANTITYLGCYMAGKLLIEQTGLRNKVVRLFVLLLAFSSIVSSYEFFVKDNLYASSWNHFYPSQYAPFTTQVRWGSGRMAGPYGQSEIAGIVLLTGWLFALWMGRTNYQEDANGVKPRSIFKHGKLVIWGTFAALYMTQARGPWIGAVIGLCFANIGRAQKPGLRAVLVVVLMIFVGIPAYTLGKGYIAGPRKNFGSDKETAQYRAELIDNYIPVAEKGGTWGWGLDFPTIGGQDSIDNEYLLVWLEQGWVGLAALLLIFGESLIRLIVQASRAPNTRHLHFSLTMMGILLAIAFTISTVFLGGQTPSLLFLLIGWVQSIRAPQLATRLIQNTDMYRAPTRSGLVGIVT